MISFPDVMKAMNACKVSAGDGVDLLSAINKFFDEMPIDRFHYILNDVKVKIHRSVVGPNMLVFVPQGHLVFERVVDATSMTPVLGARTALATSANSDDMLAFVEAYAKGAPVTALTAFWKSLLAVENIAEDVLKNILEETTEPAQPTATPPVAAAPV